MADETVTLVLDAQQYYRELANVTSANQRAGRSADGLGDGFLRGERAARAATVNIVRGLSSVNNAADATLLTVLSLERVFKIGIVPTVLATAGFAVATVISDAIDKTRQLREEIDRLKSVSKVGADFLGTDQINKNLTDTSAKIKEISDDIAGLRAGKFKFFGVDLLGSETRQGFILEDEKKLAQLREAAVGDIENLISKQNDLNAVELERLDGMETAADLDKAEIDHKERLGKLAEQVAAAGIAGTVAAQQLLEVENDRFNIAVRTLKVKQQEAQTKSLDTAAGFFADIGSGRFLQNLTEENKRTQDILRGQQQIAELRDAESKGIPLGPAAREELAIADRLAGKSQTGLAALVNADFSNLFILSKYDFSGLAPLNNLTIQIQ